MEHFLPFFSDNEKSENINIDKKRRWIFFASTRKKGGNLYAFINNIKIEDLSILLINIGILIKFQNIGK